MAGWKIGVWVAIVFAALVFLYLVRGVLLPFVVAIVISALLDPTIRKLRLKGFSRTSAVTMVFICFFGFLGTVSFFVFPIVTKQLSEFQGRLDIYMQQLSQESSSDNLFQRWNPVIRAQDVPPGPFDRLLYENQEVLAKIGVPTSRRAIVEQYIEPYRTEIVRAVRSLFTGFLSIASSAASQFLFLLLTPLLVFLMLIDLERFKTRGIAWIPPSIRSGTLGILRAIGQVFLNYLKGVAIAVSLYIFFVAIVLGILQTPYYILLAIFFGAIYLIPFVGSWVSTTMLFLITGLAGSEGNWLMHFNSSWVFATMVSCIYIIVSSIFDQLVYPRMVGRYVGLHPVASMFVTFSGGALFGLLGMILAFPLAGSIKVILERIMRITSEEHHDVVQLPAIPLRHRAL